MNASDRNRQLLHRIENNDTMLTMLKIGSYSLDSWFPPSSSAEFARLGTAIATNDRLSLLAISNVSDWHVVPREFFDGLRRNTSIHNLDLYCSGDDYNIGSGVLYEILMACQENNNQLWRLLIRYAHLENGGHQTLINTLRSCTQLKSLTLQFSNMTGQQLLPMVDAIRGNTSLLRSLEKLDVLHNRIGNEGCQALATLLTDPNTRLNILNLTNNGIGNEGVIAITNSLANNTMLKELNLDNNTFDTTVAQIAFISILCSTSSMKDTHSSNHTLDNIYLGHVNPGQQFTWLLQMNKGINKSQVAIKKILFYHPNIDMKPLFKLDGGEEDNLKALPYVIGWFERSKEAAPNSETWRHTIEQRKLSAIFDFALAMPLLFVPASHIKGVDKKRKRNVGD